MTNPIIRWWKTGSFRSTETGNLTETSDFWYNLDLGGPSSSGARVSKDSAMRQWTVYACISIISETLAQLPLKLKRPDGKGGTEDAIDHPVYSLCKTLPNNQMTSFNWREAQQANLLCTGNIYNFIQRSRYSITGIYPIAPTSVTVRTATDREVGRLRLGRFDRLVYEVQTEEGVKVYQSKDILHISGFGWDGIKGESVITNFAKESIGNAVSLDKFQGAMMRKGVHPGGVLEHPDTLGDNREAFKSALDNRYAGMNNAGSPMILENGMKFNKLDVSFVDKQFIEQTKMSANSICGIFKVPPHKVGIFEKNTNYNNTEQGNRAFLDSTMQQWVIRWEQAMNWKLLTESERANGYFFKFNFDALLRPDAKTRSEIAWKEWQSGVPMNEIRKRNDQNPIEGGDVSFVPVNMIPAELAGKQIESAIESQKAKDENGQDLVEDDVESIRKYEINAVERLIKKEKEGTCADFRARTDEIYNIIEGKLENNTTKVLRCFMDEGTVVRTVSQLKEEFSENKSKLIELQQRNFKVVADE